MSHFNIENAICFKLSSFNREYKLGGYAVESTIFFDDFSRYGLCRTCFQYKNIKYEISKLLRYHERLQSYFLENCQISRGEYLTIRYNIEDMKIYLNVDYKKYTLKDYKWMFDIIRKHIFNCDEYIIKHIMKFMY